MADRACRGFHPAYASPESFIGDVSHYSDQYGLAVVYQEMLTGIRPFHGRTTAQLLGQHQRGRPNVAPLPEGEQAVIARSLSKNPMDRFPTCGEMVQALLNVAVDDSFGTTREGSQELESAPLPTCRPPETPFIRSTAGLGRRRGPASRPSKPVPCPSLSWP